MKDRFLKSTTLVSLFIVTIILIGVFLINTIQNSNTETEEIVEEVIDFEPYANYDWTKLTGEEIKTYEDDNYTSLFGIDVAAHQDVIDWQQVKEAGVEFAYIRLGYRGATEGLLNIDEQFEYNYTNAKAVGIKVGVYWYSQPVDENEAMAEADFVYNVLNGRDLDLPIAFDFEETVLPDTYSRIHGMSKNTCTALALAFCTQMEKYGLETIIYTNQHWAQESYDLSVLDNYQIWLAQYDVETPQFDRPFIMWQYSDNGQIPGINKNCDLNIMFILKNE